MSAEDPLAIEPREPPPWAVVDRRPRRRKRSGRWIWSTGADGVRRRHDVTGSELHFIGRIEGMTGRELAYRDW